MSSAAMYMNVDEAWSNNQIGKLQALCCERNLHGGLRGKALDHSVVDHENGVLDDIIRSE